jgi:hypothetical protein
MYYKTFIVFDTGESIPCGYQKFIFHILFTLKFNLRHKVKLITFCKWRTSNKKEKFGVVYMTSMKN